MPTLQMIEKTLDNSTFGENKTKEFQEVLSGLLQIILTRVGDRVDDQTATNIVQLLTLIFNTQKKVTENGLIALSGLINGVGSRLSIESFGQFIVYALQSSEDECVRLGCGIVSDLANAF